MSENQLCDKPGVINEPVAELVEESTEAAVNKTVDIEPASSNAKKVSESDNKANNTKYDMNVPQSDKQLSESIVKNADENAQQSKTEIISHTVQPVECTAIETKQPSSCTGEAVKIDDSIKNANNEQSNQAAVESIAEVTPNVVVQSDKILQQQITESDTTPTAQSTSVIESNTTVFNTEIDQDERPREITSSLVSSEVKVNDDLTHDTSEDIKNKSLNTSASSTVGGVPNSSVLTELPVKVVDSSTACDENKSKTGDMLSVKDEYVVQTAEQNVQTGAQVVNTESVEAQSVQTNTVQAQSLQVQAVSGQDLQAHSDQAQGVQEQGVQSDSIQAASIKSHGAPAGVLQFKEIISSADEAVSEKLSDASHSGGSVPPESAKFQSVPVENVADSKLSTAGNNTAGDSSITAAAGNSARATDDEDRQTVYHIKWIGFKNEQVPIITQNDNGCCPLLAIINTLLLRGKIKLPSSSELITSNDLMAHLAECMFDLVPKNITPDSRLNYEQNMHDAIAVFPQLQTGLDVNVRFTGVSEFEYTRECIVFDLLNIPLYHGWLVDPQLPSTADAVGNCSYNQLVEKIIVQKSSADGNLATEALLAEEFLNATASQLTYHGLSELSTTLQEDQMCVLFRNNHFSTLYKRKDELFVLVTDQGLLRESSIVWETLDNVEGDGHFVDSEFRTYRSSANAAVPSGASKPASAPVTETPWAAEQPSNISTTPAAVNSKEQIDHDYLVALSLVQDFDGGATGAEAPVWPNAAAMEFSDHELAQRLQEEENRNASAAAGSASGGGAGGKDGHSDKTQSSSTASGGSAGSGRDRGREKDKEKDKSSCLVM